MSKLIMTRLHEDAGSILVGLSDGRIVTAIREMGTKMIAPTYVRWPQVAVYDPQPLYPRSSSVSDIAPVTQHTVAIDLRIHTEAGALVRCGFDKQTGHWYVQEPSAPAAALSGSPLIRAMAESELENQQALLQVQAITGATEAQILAYIRTQVYALQDLPLYAVGSRRICAAINAMPVD